MDGTALLAAIFAAPDDDEPRLVYGDWLAREGDPLGELIVLQVRRAAAYRDDVVMRDQAKALDRIVELVLAHNEQWTARFDRIARGTYSHHRGIVEHVDLYDGPLFDEVADRLYSAGALLRSAHVLPMAVDRLLLTPASRCFTRVNLVGYQREGDVFPALAEHLPELRSLQILYPEDDEFPWASCARFPVELEHFAVEHVGDDDFGKRFCTWLSETPARRALRSLRFQHVALGRAELALPALESLVLAHARLGSNIRVLDHLDLTALAIESDALSADTVEAIVREHPRLRRLTLQDAGLDAAAVTVLARSPLARQLRRLDLSKNDLGDPAMQTLLAAEWPALVALKLPAKHVEKKTLAALRDRFSAIDFVLR